MDNRTALAPDTHILLSGMDCSVEREIGRGSNAIVYKAKYPDALNKDLMHHVLLKELFPYQDEGKIYRDADNLTVVSKDDETFSMHRDSFVHGNEVHLRLRALYPGKFGNNINSCPANGTFYTLLDFTGGRTLKKDTEDASSSLTLRRIVQRMIGMAHSLSVFHEMGFLHLDVSPDNILLTNDDSDERVELIDYNSVASVSDKAHMYISSKPGFASPEVRMRSTAAIGCWTDIYSATAVFFYCLMGRPLSVLEAGGIQKPDVRGSVFLKDAPQTVTGLAMQIIAKGLNPIPRMRYQTVAELLEALYELLDRIDGVGITHSALWEVGKKSILHEVKSNPSLKYLADGRSLYPMHLRTPGNNTMEDFLRGCGNTVLCGSGGMGKTTLLMHTVLQATRHFRKDCPAVVYMSLYDYCEGDANFIHNSLLSRMKFKPETENYENARHALDVLLQEPLKTKDGTRPTLCLLLDGYNEVVGDTQNLKNEIQRISSMDGVRVLIASRSALDEFPFETWFMDALTHAEVQEILGSNGLLMPPDDEMRNILTNALMLTLFVKACTESGEQLTVKTKEQLIDAYLETLLKKELDALPENAPQRWQTEAAFHCVYPVLASLEQSRTQVISAAALMKHISDLYTVLGKRSFLKKHPQWIGHTSEIRNSCKNADEWYGQIIHDLLWRRLGLLLQCEDGSYRLLHQDFQDALSPKGRRIRKDVLRYKTQKRAALLSASVTAVLGAIAVILRFVDPLPEPYDAKKAVDAVSYVQVVYTDICHRMDSLNRLLNTGPGGPDVPSLSYYSIDLNGNGVISDDCIDFIRRCLKIGERFPWNRVAFDEVTFQSMANTLDTVTKEYEQYARVLEYARTDESADRYEHCVSLIGDVLSAEAKLVALYNYMAYTTCIDGLASWEETADGKVCVGAYSRFSGNIDPNALPESYVDEAWKHMNRDELTAAAKRYSDDISAAKKTLAGDRIYVGCEMELEKRDMEI